MVGVGLTVTVAEVVLEHPPATVVIVKVVVKGLFLLFIKIPVIEDPEPLFGTPDSPGTFVLDQEKVVPVTLFGFEMSI